MRWMMCRAISVRPTAACRSAIERAVTVAGSWEAAHAGHPKPRGSWVVLATSSMHFESGFLELYGILLGDEHNPTVPTSCLESNGILRRGEHYPPVPSS